MTRFGVEFTHGRWCVVFAGGLVAIRTPSKADARKRARSLRGQVRRWRGADHEPLPQRTGWASHAHPSAIMFYGHPSLPSLQEQP